MKDAREPAEEPAVEVHKRRRKISTVERVNGGFRSLDRKGRDLGVSKNRITATALVFDTLIEEPRK